MQNIETSQNQAVQKFGIPSVNNLVDPAEYAALGGDTNYFRSDRPSGVIGIADYNYLEEDLFYHATPGGLNKKG